jgi:glycerol-3-phosphate O-acyltransferase
MKQTGLLRRRWSLQQAALASRVQAKDSLLADERFRDGVLALAGHGDLEPEAALGRASAYLNEMVTAQSEAVPEFNQILGRIADRRGFEGVVQYDEGALERLAALDADHTLVVTTAHRSYLDFVVRVPFAARGFEREYRFAGANILFWPMGPIGHAFGIIYIRRGFRDPLYTFVLRQYVGWLTEHRRNFMWALEGGRTRTGKLLAPKAGLLAYVADAYVEGRAADVTLVPTTVVYEYLNEVFEYAKYGRGAAKVGESLLAFVRFAREQRRVPPEAKIFVAIGEPVPLGQFVDKAMARDSPEFTAGVTRAAMEMCRRIDSVTPITSVALVLLALLERTGTTMTFEDLSGALEPTLRRIELLRLPKAEPDLGSELSLRRALRLLLAQGLVAHDRGSNDPRYAVAPGRHIEASYYRNGIVHFFAVRSLIELAVVRSTAAPSGVRVSAFWSEVERLRDLLKHEFFFPEGDGFQIAVQGELAAHDPDWQQTLESEDGVDGLLDRLGGSFAPRVLASFLEAYKVVADGLCRRARRPVADERHFLLDCRAQALLELSLGRLQRSDAASLNMFDIPVKVARERGLMREPGFAARRAFASEIDQYLESVSSLEARGFPPSSGNNPEGAAFQGMRTGPAARS